MRPIPFNPAEFGDAENPPPKAAYLLLDRPMPESAEGLSMENMPRLLGQALLFGRQTDREARLELQGVAGDELAAVTGLIGEVAGDAVGQVADPPALKKEVVGHWSASQKLLRAAWQPPRDASPEQLRQLSEAYGRRAILDQWPELKLGIFGGRSPRQVAGDPAYRIRFWRPSWCWNTGRSDYRGNSTSTNCAPRWACRSSNRSIRSNIPWTTCRPCGWGG